MVSERFSLFLILFPSYPVLQQHWQSWLRVYLMPVGHRFWRNRTYDWFVSYPIWSDYHPVDSPQSVTLANGSLAKVEGSGSYVGLLRTGCTSWSPDLLLFYVFTHFPFFPSVCIFQDLETKRMLGMGHGMKLVAFIIWTLHLSLLLEHSSVAERKNRHLLEVARALLFNMHVPISFWSDSVLTAFSLINRMPFPLLHRA